MGIFGKDTTLSISAFPLMTGAEMEVWKAYCPKREWLEETNQPIHEEALRILEHTKKNEMFLRYEIWSESEAEIDPILVGVNVNDRTSEDKKKELLSGKRYDWQNDYFLICRWGESIKPFNEIKALAFKNKLATQTIDLKQAIKNHQRELEDLEDKLRKDFAYFD